MGASYAGVAYAYDEAGNNTVMTLLNTSQTGQAANIRYARRGKETLPGSVSPKRDGLNRISGVRFGNVTNGQWSGNVGYQYDRLSRVPNITRGNGTKTSYSYEADSDLSQMRHEFAR